MEPFVLWENMCISYACSCTICNYLSKGCIRKQMRMLNLMYISTTLLPSMTHGHSSGLCMFPTSQDTNPSIEGPALTLFDVVIQLSLVSVSTRWDGWFRSSSMYCFMGGEAEADLICNLMKPSPALCTWKCLFQHCREHTDLLARSRIVCLNEGPLHSFL